MGNLFSYSQVGTKIKNLVTVVCWIECILGWIGCLALFIMGIDSESGLLCLLGVVLAALTPLLVWLEGLFVFAFGELVESTSKIRATLVKETPEEEFDDYEEEEYEGIEEDEEEEEQADNAEEEREMPEGSEDIVCLCPRCESIVEEGDKKCWKCGAALSW